MNLRERLFGGTNGMMLLYREQKVKGQVTEYSWFLPKSVYRHRDRERKRLREREERERGHNVVGGAVSRANASSAASLLSLSLFHTHIIYCAVSYYSSH